MGRLNRDRTWKAAQVRASHALQNYRQVQGVEADAEKHMAEAQHAVAEAISLDDRANPKKRGE